nr:hypothetical protein L204_03339 [Cryptococcus depauperatus CBS 7855]
MSSPATIVHLSPPLEPLPASDAESLFFASLLCLANVPEAAISTADWGLNNGGIPYVTHMGRRVDLSSLESYNNPDDFLSVDEEIDSQCWKAYIQHHIVDLVNHTLYSLPPNYSSMTVKAQCKGLTFPQNQYIPQRLRSLVKSRLEFVGLWGLGGLNIGDAIDEDRKRSEEQFIVGPGGTVTPRAWSGWRSGQETEKRHRKWGEQQLEARIKTALDPISRRLGNRSFFFSDKPSTLDLALYSQLTLILKPTLPSSLFPNIIRKHYPSLVSFHERLAELIPLSEMPLQAQSLPKQVTWRETFKSWFPMPNSVVQPAKEVKTSKQRKMERGRWLWFTAAGLSMVTYLFASGIISINLGEENQDETEWIEVDDEKEEIDVRSDEDDEG